MVNASLCGKQSDLHLPVKQVLSQPLQYTKDFKASQLLVKGNIGI